MDISKLHDMAFDLEKSGNEYLILINKIEVN